LRLFVAILIFLTATKDVRAYQVVPSVTRWSQELGEGYRCRIAADPSFPQKSLTEVLMAAGSQFAAEWNRRGSDRLIPEADFVVPAILTAVFGKYYR
jgi:hypothetical protein